MKLIPVCVIVIRMGHSPQGECGLKSSRGQTTGR